MIDEEGEPLPFDQERNRYIDSYGARVAPPASHAAAAVTSASAATPESALQARCSG